MTSNDLRVLGHQSPSSYGVTKATRRAIWFGGVAAVLTFVPIFFDQGIEDWWLAQGGIFVICGWGDDFSEMRAYVWAFVAFAAVFTPTLLISAGRIRHDVFRGGIGSADFKRHS